MSLGHRCSLISADGTISVVIDHSSRARVLILTVLGSMFLVAAGLYVGLYPEAFGLRPAPFHFYILRMLPVGAAHLGAFLLLRLFSGGRRLSGSAIFWALSLLVLFAFGGPVQAGAFAGAVLMLALALLLGRSMTGPQNGGDRAGPALATGAGITLVSVAAAALAALGKLEIWMVCILILALLAYSVRRDTQFWQDTWRSAKAALGKEQSLSNAVAFELAFLLLIVLLVQSSGPEQRSDAIRFYWPYISILSATGSFPEVSNQWSYVIPQPGLAWSAVVHLLFGAAAARLSMLIAMVALVWVIVVQSRESSTGMALACAVASTPLLIWTTTSVMQEAFVSLAVVTAVSMLLRLTTLSYRQWIVTGLVVGAALTAKYSAGAFVLPTLGFALYRSVRAHRPLDIVGRTACLLLAVLTSAAPWLHLAWRRTGNIFFPLGMTGESAILPEAATANLSQFRLPPNVGGWLAAPFLITFDSDRFIEGFSGTMGIAFLLLLAVAALVFFVSSSGNEKAFLILSATGAILLWSYTAYARYWIPAIWMLVVPSAAVLATLVSHRRAIVPVAAAGLVCCLHIPVVLAMNWMDPQGWPWDFYSRRVSYSEYVDRSPEGGLLRRLSEIDSDWPRLWFTDVDKVGYFPAVPMEASVWAFAQRHGVGSAEEAHRMIDAANADYWIVKHGATGARHFEAWQVADRYWKDSLRVLVRADLAVYRLPGSRRAAAAVARYRNAMAAHARALSRNGSFELGEGDAVEDWIFRGNVRPVSGGASDGARFLMVSGTSDAVQHLPIEPELSYVTLDENIRCPVPIDVRLQVNWGGRAGETIGAQVDVIRCDPRWKRYTTTASVPRNARSVSIFLTNQDPAGVSHIDDVVLTGFTEPPPR
jgi:hypothetical protein